MRQVDCPPSGLAGSVRSVQGASLERVLEAGVVAVEGRVLAEELMLERGVRWEAGGEARPAGGRSSAEPQALLAGWVFSEGRQQTGRRGTLAVKRTALRFKGSL